MIAEVNINYKKNTIEITCTGSDYSTMTEEVVSFCTDIGVTSDISFIESNGVLYAYTDFSVASLHVL